jgi:hypothetical protein
MRKPLRIRLSYVLRLMGIRGAGDFVHIFNIRKVIENSSGTDTPVKWMFLSKTPFIKMDTLSNP